MTRIKIFIAAMMAAFAIVFAPRAQAQFRFGVQAGVNVNEFHFSSSTFDSNNRMGFNAGLLGEFTLPATGVGLDFGARYVRRNSRWESQTGASKDNRDYIEIPINLKWKVNIPLINNIVRPFATTGPSFAFLTSHTLGDTYRNRKFDTAWNFGFGLEFFKKVQIGASYGLGLTKALKTVGATGTSNIEGKNRYWTVTATYLFR